MNENKPTEPLEEYKSDNVTFTINPKENCIVEYHVTASAPLVKNAQSQAIRAISKEVSIPGFRKGKAPSDLILKKYSKQVEERWKKTIADLTFQECQKLSNIPVLSSDTRIIFNLEKHSLEEGAEMTFSFEREPLVPEIALDKIELKKLEPEIVDDKKIDDTLSQIQAFFADWEKVSGREVQEGDFVLIDIDLLEGETPQRIFTDARFEVKEGVMAQWMKELVIGMKIGESKEGISKPDKEASEEEKEATPPKKVCLILKGIEISKPPDIDNNLAQKVGAKTVKEMREKIEKLLHKQTNEHLQKGYRDQIKDFLLSTYPFDLPRTIIQKETQFRLKQLIADPHFQKKFASMNEEERKEMIKNIENQGKQAVCLFYIARKIAHDYKIPISPQEIHKEVTNPLEALLTEQTDFYNAKEESQEQQAIAMSRLLLIKAEDFLISKATITS
jgi:trigger factor